MELRRSAESGRRGSTFRMKSSAAFSDLRTRIRAFFRLGRPKFLVGGVALYALGAAIAAYLGHRIDWTRFAWGQLAVSATQAMTHYSNDYFDLEIDKASYSPLHWSGGSGVLPSGALPRWVALVAAIALAALALFAAVVLATRLSGGLGALTILVGAMVLSWEYSGPPLRLHSRGLGELVAMGVVTILVPLAGFYSQALTIEPLVLVSVAPLCFLQFAMLLAVEFPDEAGDAIGGKHTLVVRLGSAKAALLYVVALTLTYVLLPALMHWGLPAEAVWGLVMLSPIAVWLALRIARGEHRHPKDWDRISLGSAALLLLSTLLELAVYLRLTPRHR
jgi:1,4-dihydroxy-2-naphthoate octaprenyltransferase